MQRRARGIGDELALHRADARRRMSRRPPPPRASRAAPRRAPPPPPRRPRVRSSGPSRRRSTAPRTPSARRRRPAAARRAARPPRSARRRRRRTRTRRPPARHRRARPGPCAAVRPAKTPVASRVVVRRALAAEIGQENRRRSDGVFRMRERLGLIDAGADLVGAADDGGDPGQAPRPPTASPTCRASGRAGRGRRRAACARAG